jgi:dTDP-4-amino-4,6-dideoxygalactose transaminase
MSIVPFERSHLDDTDIISVSQFLRSGVVPTGTRVREFEQQFAEVLSMRHAVAVNTCTAALHLALDALGLQPDDEVIVPALSFASDIEVIRYFEAIPVLVDVLPNSLCIDPEAVLKAITPRTRAIISVHFAGCPPRMDEIMPIARKHSLIVIEDAVHGLPSAYRRHTAGTMGHISAVSVEAGSLRNSSFGGVLMTNDDLYADRARSMAFHGLRNQEWRDFARGRSGPYDVVAPGFEYVMADLTAVLGIAQLQKLDTLYERRIRIAGRYSQLLSAYKEFDIPQPPAKGIHSWHFYLLRLNLDRLSIDRDRFIDELQKRGIESNTHCTPVHMLTFYRRFYGYHEGMFPVAHHEGSRMLALPIYPSMSDEDVDSVIEALSDVVISHRRGKYSASA